MAQTTATEAAQPSQLIHQAIARDRANYLPDGEKVSLYRDYVDGKHLLQLTEHMQAVLEGLLGHKFCENLAKKVVAEGRDRLRFEGWACENAAVKKWLDDLFSTARIKERQGKIHFDTLRDGNHAVAVNWDNTAQAVRIYREPWWDGTEGVFIGYNAVDEPVYAVKDWVVPNVNGTSTLRRIIYFDDRFERWISADNGATWAPFILPEDNGVWPIPWVKTDGTPLHIPYVHFKDAGQGEDVYGTSELAGGLLGLIDQVQDIHYALSGAARLNGFPIVTIAGIQLPLKAGSETEYEEPKAAAGMILHSTNPDTKFGILQPGSPEGLKMVREVKLQAISVSARVPLHVITGGDWPSGEALMRAEQPAVGKAETQVDTFEQCWVSVAHKATEVWNRFGNGPKLIEDVKVAMIGANFAPTERRDPLSKSVIVNNLGDHISNREALKLMGYDDADADRIIKEKQDEGKAAAENQALLFSRGVGRGTELPGRGETGAGAGAGAGAGGGAGEGGASNNNGKGGVVPPASGNADKSRAAR
jgi:hypothetical protein